MNGIELGISSGGVRSHSEILLALTKELQERKQ